MSTPTNFGAAIGMLSTGLFFLVIAGILTILGLVFHSTALCVAALGFVGLECLCIYRFLKA